jgi:hypothetical protein
VADAQADHGTIGLPIDRQQARAPFSHATQGHDDARFNRAASRECFMIIEVAGAPRRSNAFRRTAIVAGACLASQLAGCAVGAFTQTRSITQENVADYPTKAVLQQRMGSPNEIQCKPEGQEVWIYNGTPRWSGTFLWAIIVPLPLMIPAGRDNWTFTLDGDRVTSFTKNLTQQCESSLVAAPSNPIGRSGGTVGNCGILQFDVDRTRIEEQQVKAYCSAAAQRARDGS